MLLTTLKNTLAAHRADGHPPSAGAELAAFSTPAERLEIETIAGRYSDDEALEVRQILFRLAG